MISYSNFVRIMLKHWSLNKCSLIWNKSVIIMEFRFFENVGLFPALFSWYVPEIYNHAAHVDRPGKINERARALYCLPGLGLSQGECLASTGDFVLQISWMCNHRVTIDVFHAVWKATCYFLVIMASSSLSRGSAAVEDQLPLLPYSSRQ